MQRKNIDFEDTIISLAINIKIYTEIYLRHSLSLKYSLFLIFLLFSNELENRKPQNLKQYLTRLFRIISLIFHIGNKNVKKTI
jgi:hypothetical protein